MKNSRWSTALLGGALAATGLIATAPIASAIDSVPVTENRNFDYTCLGTEYELLNGRTLNAGDPAHKIVNTSGTQVTYPKQIAPGQPFSVTIAPGQWKTSGEEAGAIKYDVALPAGVEVTGISNAGGASGLTQQGGSLRVERVAANGSPAAGGEFARIWGQSTVNNGGNASINDPKRGIYSVRSGTFRLPAVKIDMIAPPTPGARIDVGLRGAGTAAERMGTSNVLSFGLDKRDGVFGTDNFNNDDYWCTSPASTAALSSTYVVADTAAELTTTDLTIETGSENTRLAARVTVPGSGTVVDAGEVEFLVDGTAIGRAPVVAGTAEITHTFPPLNDRDPARHVVTARYMGVSNAFVGSSATETTATVVPKPKSQIATSTAVTATRGKQSDGTVPVNLVTTIDTSDGSDLPDGAEVEILRDGVVIGTAQVNGQTATFTDHVPAPTTEASTYGYTARLLSIETYDSIYAASAESEAATVTLTPEYTTTAMVEVSPKEVLVGHPVDVSATLAANGAPILAGQTVTFRANGRDIGTATTDADGRAFLPSHVFTSPGQKQIVASFDGTTTEAGTYSAVSSQPVAIEVKPLPTAQTRVVLALTTTAVAGDDVEMKAKLTREDGAALTAADAAKLGSVWFFADGKAIGSAPVTIDQETGDASATFVHTFAERGEYRVTAEYSGATVGDEVLAASETAEATKVIVTPTEIIIVDPEPEIPGGQSGSIDLGSLGSSGSLGSLGSVR